MEVCDSIPDFTAKGFNGRVKSVWVPEGFELRIYENKNYEGGKYSVVRTNECLADSDRTFNFLLAGKSMKRLHQKFLKNNN